MIQNGQLLAVFNSAHRVMKAENILKGCKMAIQLIPAPRALSTDCALALCFSNDHLDSVLQTLSSEKCLPAVIFRKVSDTSYEIIWNLESP